MGTDSPEGLFEDPKQIERHAQQLIGKTFRDVLIAASGKNNIRGKGSLGQIIEKHFFGYDLNSNKQADFQKANLELKVTAYKTNKNGIKTTKERLVLNIINFHELCTESFDTSSFLLKNKNLLMIFYHYDPLIKDKLDFRIDHVGVYSIPNDDLVVIQKDWLHIQQRIKDGKAHLLSEKETCYLGACTKGKNKKSLRSQPYCEELAMQRAFCLKSGYLKRVFKQRFLAEEVVS